MVEMSGLVLFRFIYDTFGYPKRSFKKQKLFGMRFLKCVIFCFLLGSGGVRAASFDTSQVILNAKLNIIPLENK